MKNNFIIKKENNKYVLYNVSHTPINLTPFTQPDNIQDCIVYMKKGYLCELNGLELDTEYELDDNDFSLFIRDVGVKHDDELIYDDLYFKYVPDKTVY